MAGYRFDSNGLPEKTPHSATHFEVVAVREFGARACRDSSTYFLPIQGRYEASSAMQSELDAVVSQVARTSSNTKGSTQKRLIVKSDAALARIGEYLAGMLRTSATNFYFARTGMTNSFKPHQSHDEEQARGTERNQ